MRSQIRDAYADFVARVAEVAATALTQGMTTVFVQAIYDPACVYKPPLFLPEPARPDYGCHPGSWGADFVEPNVCVLCTALSALSNSFRTVILEDCVTTSHAELQAPTLQIIEVAKG